MVQGQLGGRLSQLFQVQLSVHFLMDFFLKVFETRLRSFEPRAQFSVHFMVLLEKVPFSVHFIMVLQGKIP